MNSEKQLVAGVDIVDQRFVVCLLNEAGKDPKYYSGRSDTAAGQEKFFSLVENRIVVMPPDPLSSIAFHRLGERSVMIDRGYGAYWASGIERGERMARFAALLVFNQDLGTTVLTQKEQKEILAKQQEELDSLIAFTEQVTPLMERLVNGSATPKDVQQMIQLEVESRYPGISNPPVAEERQLLDPAEDTFFARLFRYLKDLT